jgi:hypothetical protein
MLGRYLVLALGFRALRPDVPAKTAQRSSLSKRNAETLWKLRAELCYNQVVNQSRRNANALPVR